MPAKKKAPAKAHKVRSRGVWIAPDLERKIKGEGGRRGLVDPPYSYYLHLADLVLKPSSSHAGSNAPIVAKEPKPEVPLPLVEPPPLQTIASPPAPVMPVRPGPSSSLVDAIPAPLPPIAPALILPTLQLPKPPKRAETPKPARRVAPKRPKSAVRPKLSIPKPPKR